MKSEKQIIGLTCGTFDLFHKGHVNILRNAKNYCDRLIVAISTDELAIEYKKKIPFMNYSARKTILEACKYVDIVIPQESLNKEHLINKLNIDYLFVGDDWYGTTNWNNLEKYIKETKNKCKIIYFPYTKNISTSIIKEKLKND